MGLAIKLYKETSGAFTLTAEQANGSVIIFTISSDDAMRLAWTIFQHAGEEAPEGSIEIEEEEDGNGD